MVMKKIELKSVKKGYTYDQDKVIMPEETVKIALERIKQYRYPLIKSFVKANNRFNIPIYRINSSDEVRNRYYLEGTNGKGAVESQSQASCIMEFVERFSAKTYGGWEKHRYSDIAEEALQLESIAKTLGYRDSDLKDVLHELSGIEMDWAKGCNLTSGRDEYLPKMLYDVSTTGLAAGNTMEEAILQAASECVERHVGAHVQRHGGTYDTIDRAGIKSEVILELLEKIETKGIDVVLKDFSCVLGIPAIGVIAIDRAHRDNIGQAIGVSTGREKALIRALTETVQGGFKGDYACFNKITLKNPTLSLYFDNYAGVKNLLAGPVRQFHDVPDLCDDDLRVEIEKYVGILRVQSYELIALDMTENTLAVPACWVYLTGAQLVYKKTSLLFHIGVVYYQNKQYDKAVRKLEQSVYAGEQKTKVAFFQIGMCFQNLGRHSEAVNNFQKALALAEQDDEDLWQIYYRAGLSYSALGEHETALDFLNKAIGKESANTEVYPALGSCYQSLGKYSDALRFYDLAYSSRSDVDEAVCAGIDYQRGLCRLNLREYADAVESFTRVCGLKEKKLEFYLNIGVDCSKSDGFRALNGELIDLNFNTGICYHELKRYDNAIRSYAAALKYANAEKSGKTGDIRFRMGLSYLESGDCSSALENLESARIAAADKTGNAAGYREILFNLGICCENLQQWARALGFFSQAKKIASENESPEDKERVRFSATLHYHMGICLVESGDAENGVLEIQAAIKERSEDINNYNLLAGVYLRLKEYKNGREAIERGIARCGTGDWRSYKLMGVICRELGETAKAEGALKKAIEYAPSEWSNYNVLGNIYRDTGRENDAYAMYAEAVTRAPESYRDRIDEKMKRLKV
jgi:ribosomal protein S12 methylthiotransferase accessory factor